MAGFLGVAVCILFQLLKYFTDYHETWYKHYAYGGRMLLFPELTITALRTCELVRLEGLILKLCVVTDLARCKTSDTAVCLQARIPTQRP